MKTLACPTCFQIDKTLVALVCSPTKAQCPKGHSFDDMIALREMNPPTVEDAKLSRPIVPGDAVMQVRVSSQVRDALQGKYGDRLEATISSLLGVMTDARAFVMTSGHIDRVFELTQQKVSNGQALTGLIFTLATEKQAAEERVSQLSGKPVRQADCIEVPKFNDAETLKLEAAAEKHKVEGTNRVGKLIHAIIRQGIVKGWF